MWLPTPVYESLPYAYIGTGIVLIGGASYLGLHTDAAPVYLGTGAISVLLGVLVHLRRAHARMHQREAVDGAPALEAEAGSAPSHAVADPATGAD